MIHVTLQSVFVPSRFRFDICFFLFFILFSYPFLFVVLHLPSSFLGSPLAELACRSSPIHHEGTVRLRPQTPSFQWSRFTLHHTTLSQLSLFFSPLLHMVLSPAFHLVLTFSIRNPAFHRSSRRSCFFSLISSFSPLICLTINISEVGNSDFEMERDESRERRGAVGAQTRKQNGMREKESREHRIFSFIRVS